MAIRNTGVFATLDERNALAAHSANVRRTPLIEVCGKWMPDVEREGLMRAIDDCAISHGLPTPKRIGGDVNHYGMTIDGEFTAYEEDGVEHVQYP